MSDSQHHPLLHSIGAAAARLGELSESTIWRLIRSGKLRPVKILGRTLIPESELRRVAQEGAMPGPDASEPAVDLQDVQDDQRRRGVSRRINRHNKAK